MTESSVNKDVRGASAELIGEADLDGSAAAAASAEVDTERASSALETAPEPRSSADVLPALSEDTLSPVSKPSNSIDSELALSSAATQASGPQPDGGGLREILGRDRNELAAELKATLGLEPFRARQLIQWLYRERHTSFSGMTNISREVREKLERTYSIFRPEVETSLLSQDGSRKFLFRLRDGMKVESVLIKQPARYTLCISSQVGCAIGCKFCRTGLMGLTRHLESAEIIGQVLAVQDEIERLRALAQSGEDIGTVPEQFQNIVFMGMGEPLHNYDNMSRAVRLLNDELGCNFSSRKITVSTSGVVPAIERFGAEELPANLAISLNATTDQVRTEVIPINKKWPLDQLLQTLRAFPLKGRRRITIEYVMLKGVNDTADDLARLPKLLRGIPSKINLIPYNQNTGLGFYPPDRATIDHWQNTLLQKGLNATIRWSKGEDISAACGQLATEAMRKKRAAAH